MGPKSSSKEVQQKIHHSEMPIWGCGCFRRGGHRVLVNRGLSAIGKIRRECVRVFCLGNPRIMNVKVQPQFPLFRVVLTLLPSGPKVMARFTCAGTWMTWLSCSQPCGTLMLSGIYRDLQGDTVRSRIRTPVPVVGGKWTRTTTRDCLGTARPVGPRPF